MASAGDREPCRWYAAERLGSSRTAALCDALARSGRPRAAGDDYTSELQRARLLGVDSDVDSDGPHGASGSIAAVTWLFRTPRRRRRSVVCLCVGSLHTLSLPQEHAWTSGRSSSSSELSTVLRCAPALWIARSFRCQVPRMVPSRRGVSVAHHRVLTTRHRRSNPGNVYPAAEAIDRVSTDAPRGHTTGHVTKATCCAGFRQARADFAAAAQSS